MIAKSMLEFNIEFFALQRANGKYMLHAKKHVLNFKAMLCLFSFFLLSSKSIKFFINSFHGHSFSKSLVVEIPNAYLKDVIRPEESIFSILSY